MKELLASVLDRFGMAVWVEVTTESPHCTYYFGPFSSINEAESAQSGYLEDLETEGASGISVKIVKRSKPERLTILDDVVERVPSLSGR